MVGDLESPVDQERSSCSRPVESTNLDDLKLGLLLEQFGGINSSNL